MNQKERLEEIRKRHEEERRRKSIRRNRILLAIAAALALLLIILAITGCVKAVSRIIENRRAEQERIAAEQAANATPVPTPSYTINPNEISMNYYADSAFVGNSFVDDLFMFDFLSDADYFYKIGLSVDEAMTEPTATGKVPVIDELDTDKRYKRIFMVFGINELGWTSSDIFTERYNELIGKAQQYQPQSEIYLLAITPVTKKKSETNGEINNDRIKMYNEYIKQLAVENNVIYADIYRAVADKEGNLPEGAATDGIHFGKEYYEKCLLYIQNNYQ